MHLLLNRMWNTDGDPRYKVGGTSPRFQGPSIICVPRKQRWVKYSLGPFSSLPRAISPCWARPQQLSLGHLSQPNNWSPFVYACPVQSILHPAAGEVFLNGESCQSLLRTPKAFCRSQDKALLSFLPWFHPLSPSCSSCNKQGFSKAAGCPLYSSGSS